MGDKIIQKKKKEVKNATLEAAKKILDNPDMVNVEYEETEVCYHEHFTKLTKESVWYQCDHCGNVMALVDFICYKDQITLLKDVVQITESAKEMGRNVKKK